jgi:hypothetical protein
MWIQVEENAGIHSRVYRSRCQEVVLCRCNSLLFRGVAAWAEQFSWERLNNRPNRKNKYLSLSRPVLLSKSFDLKGSDDDARRSESLSFGILNKPENTTFRKLDLFPFSGGGRETPAETFRKSLSQSPDQWGEGEACSVGSLRVNLNPWTIYLLSRM